LTPAAADSAAAAAVSTTAGTAAIATAAAATTADTTAPASAATTTATPASAPPHLLHILPHATQIARLALPDVTAGHLIPAEAATPIYLRDNVAHVPQPPKPRPHVP
jgi:tRNA A37 threonylcarbamoyladenosine modification protein TsaB